MKRKQVLVAAVLVPLVLFAVGCSSDSKADSAKAKSTTTAKATTTTAAPAAAGTAMGSAPTGDTRLLNITQIAAGTAPVSTVTRLVIYAGLLPTLRDGGPFTVFAPVNDAFAKVDPATLQSVVGDTKTLQSVLTLHVVAQELTTKDLKALDGQSVTTVNGGKLKVEVKGEDIYVGGAKIIIPNVAAKNGVIQVVDTVITAPNA
jgi:uncharacterized surface protein with fasciclin (FAS1) repeats